MKKVLGLLKRRNNGGFTLIEVIISCALLAILILAVMGMVTPVMSVVMNNEKNANALMIAEAVEAHIDRNIKNSVYCAVFTNAQYSDLSDSTGLVAKHKALEEMINFIKDGDNGKIYDLKCIALKWTEDTRTHQRKYMLTNIKPKITVSGDTITDIKFEALTSDNETKIFEECFYDNLYPDVKFEVLKYYEYPSTMTEAEIEADKTDSPPYTKATKARNVALKTMIDVYSDSAMTSRAAEGIGYADFINIRTTAINRDDTYKLYSIDGDSTTAVPPVAHPIENATQVRDDAAFTAAFPDTVTQHPETYVIFVTRKLKYYEAPATPSP